MLKSLKNDNVAVRLSDARYRSDAKYGEEIKINGVGKVNIRDYVKGEPLTRDGWGDQSTLIKIDQQKYFNFGVDDIDKRQAQGDLMAALREEANLALSEAADRYVYSFYPEAGQVVEQASRTSGSSVLSTITAAIKALYKNNVPKNAAFSLEVSPDFLEKMLLADVIYGNPNGEYLQKWFRGKSGQVAQCERVHDQQPLQGRGQGLLHPAHQAGHCLCGEHEPGGGLPPRGQLRGCPQGPACLRRQGGASR